MQEDDSQEMRRGETMRRRTFIAATGIATAGAVGVAGCLGNGGGENITNAEPMAEPVDSTAVSWDDLGDLEGEIDIYSGRTSDQIDPLFDRLEAEYPDLTIEVSHDDNDVLVNQLAEERDASPADLFYSQDAGALAEAKAADVAQELPDDIVNAVDNNYMDDDGRWVGASGRVRAIQYNTELWDGGAEALPDDIMDFAFDDRFEGIISTRPNSGTFRAFIMAMLELEGEDATREWLEAMVEDQNVTTYAGGSAQAEAVRSGEQAVALGNQYYAGRILNEDSSAPIDVAFTENDAGCLFNVSGIAVTPSVSDAELVAEFVRHLVAREGQEFFVEVNGEYPVVDGVEYIGELPTLNEINPPEFNLSQLDLDLQEVQDLLNETGMVV